MGFGEDDDNIEDGEDVCEETYDDTDDADDTADDTRDEIDKATTPLVRTPLSPFSRRSSHDNKGPSRIMRCLFSCTDVCTSEGLMPAFPAGRLPFLVCAAMGAASLSAIALFYLSVSKVGKPNLI